MAAKKIIVTGGTGYIGSHTAVELIQAGYEVVIVDNLSNSPMFMLDGIIKITGNYDIVFQKLDLTDRKNTKAFFNAHKDAEGVIHFAAFKAVGESVKKPLVYYRNNLESLINVTQGMIRNEIPHMIFSSSCTVYGQPDALPVTEASPVRDAESPYGATKQFSERILKDVCSTNKKMNVCSLRYFNPIGAHPSAEIGELPSGTPNNLIPYLTQTAIGLRECLSVFGSDYKTPDGTAIRDFIHVVDLAQAHVKALEFLMNEKERKNYEVFNLGTGKGYSVLEVIQSFERSTGIKVNYKLTDRRPGDVECIYANTDRSNKVLDWKALHSLDDMTRSSWEWEKKLKLKNEQLNLS